MPCCAGWSKPSIPGARPSSTREPNSSRWSRCSVSPGTASSDPRNWSSEMVRSAPETRPSLLLPDPPTSLFRAPACLDRPEPEEIPELSSGGQLSGKGRKPRPDRPPGFVGVQAGELPQWLPEGPHDLVGYEESRAPVALDLPLLEEGLHRTGIFLLECPTEEGEEVRPVLPAPRQPVLEPPHPVPEVLFLGAARERFPRGPDRQPFEKTGPRQIVLGGRGSKQLLVEGMSSLVGHQHLGGLRVREPLETPEHRRLGAEPPDEGVGGEGPNHEHVEGRGDLLSSQHLPDPRFGLLEDCRPEGSGLFHPLAHGIEAGGEVDGAWLVLGDCVGFEHLGVGRAVLLLPEVLPEPGCLRPRPLRVGEERGDRVEEASHG